MVTAAVFETLKMLGVLALFIIAPWALIAALIATLYYLALAFPGLVFALACACFLIASIKFLAEHANKTERVNRNDSQDHAL